MKAPLEWQAEAQPSASNFLLNLDFPSSSTPQWALVGRHGVSPRHQPRGHHWYLLIFIGSSVEGAPSPRARLKCTASASRRFVLHRSLSIVLTFSLPSVPLACKSIAPRIYLSWQSLSHRSPILRCTLTSAMRSTWASRQSWIRSRTNALST